MRSNLVRRVLIAIVWAGFVLYPFGRLWGPLAFLGPALAMPAMGVLYAESVVRTVGKRRAAVLFLIGLVMPWLSEWIGLQTGVPFGRFAYTGVSGVRILSIPLVVLAAYPIVSWWAWQLAGSLLPSRRSPASRVGLATLLMVAWNLVHDPVRSTIEGRWTWFDGGVWSGVPLSNSAGWLLTCGLVFAAFAAVDRDAARPANPAAGELRTVPAMMYLALALEYLVHVAVPQPPTEIVVAGTAYATDAIYWNAAVVALLTMVPVGLLAIARERRQLAHSPRPAAS